MMTATRSRSVVRRMLAISFATLSASRKLGTTIVTECPCFRYQRFAFAASGRDMTPAKGVNRTGKVTVLQTTDRSP